MRMIFCRFPNKCVLQLLLSCGSRWLDIDAVESSHGDTPLHVICKQSNNRQILKLFLELDCHTDCVDKYGRMPIDYVKDLERKILFPSERIPSKLKCLCAHLIVKRRMNINRLAALPNALQKFVILHGYQFSKKRT